MAEMPGIAGRFSPDSVDDLPRNHWTIWIGIGGRFAPEYAAAAFGSETYSKEELVAELGAAFLCGTVGIEQRTLSNSAAYLQNWMQALRGDARLIVTAASAAQRAADFILGKSESNRSEDADERETGE